MATFIGLRHPVTIFVTVFNNPDNLANDLFILKLLITNKSSHLTGNGMLVVPFDHTCHPLHLYC